MKIKIVLIPLAVIFSLIAVVFITLLWFSPGKVSTARGESNSLAEKIFLEIGGIRQGMILESKNTGNPVLLILHGGPGSTEYAAFKHYNVGLENLFTVCYWEQRGSGMSYNTEIDSNTMTLNQLISDTVEVTNYLRNRFEKEKIYIMGHSWGTLLGSHVINQNPDLYHAYIGVGQIANTLKSEKEIYEFIYSTAKARNDKPALDVLETWNVDDDNTFKTGDHLPFRMTYVTKYGGGIMHSETSTLSFLIQLIFCKAYTISEKINFVYGLSFSGRFMTHYVLDANLTASLSAQNIPVYIIAGKYDYQTTSNQALLYYEVLEAPAKAFYLFENSAHSPMFEEPQLFIEILKEVLKNF